VIPFLPLPGAWPKTMALASYVKGLDLGKTSRAAAFVDTGNKMGRQCTAMKKNIQMHEASFRSINLADETFDLFKLIEGVLAVLGDFMVVASVFFNVVVLASVKD